MVVLGNCAGAAPREVTEENANVSWWEVGNNLFLKTGVTCAYFYYDRSG